MATKKKHKKKKNISSKPSFYDTFYKTKESSIEEYIQQLTDAGFHTSKEEILKQYEALTSVEDLVLSVSPTHRTVYQKLLLKLIPEQYDLHTLCDPYYIYADALSLSNTEMEIQEEITEIYKLMKRIENMYAQQKKDLMYFHHVYDFDITTFLVTAFIRYASICPNDEQMQEAENQANNLLSIYKKNQSFFADMKAALLCGYAASGNIEIANKKKEELLNMYPKEPYFVYYSLLHGIASSKNIDKFEDFYKEAMKYMVFSAEEQTFKDQITLLYKAYKEYLKGAKA